MGKRRHGADAEDSGPRADENNDDNEDAGAQGGPTSKKRQTTTCPIPGDIGKSNLCIITTPLSVKLAMYISCYFSRYPSVSGGGGGDDGNADPNIEIASVYR